MKKSLALLLALVMVFSFAACGGSDNASESTAPESSTSESTAPESTAPEANTYEIALVTDVGNIDDKSFNEGTWNGVKQYADDNGITYNYYRPSEDSTEARVEAISTAVEKGAKVVVCPGYMFAETLYIVQDKFPEVMFLGLDVAATDMMSAGGVDTSASDFSVDSYNMSDYVKSNVALITYREEQSGFLAGYAAVKEGYTKLGFLGGMAVPAVVRYGYGFVQGVDAAAKEDGVQDVQLNYWYGNTFGPSDDVKVKMDSWFTGGTQVVFACGGGIYLSAVQAAEQAGGKIIGVDSDQSGESDLIITSAMKDLTNSTVEGLTALYDNGGVWTEDYAGNTMVLGAAEGSVALPTAESSWRFENFTIDQYNAIFDKIASGEVAVSNAIDKAPDVTNVTVDYQE
ncbi:MAG: BMP family protein [Oscillospiraceae bacterium]